MLTIRRATAKDWQRIRTLIKRYPQTLVQEPLPPRHFFFVAVIDKKVVACCALEIYSKRLAEVRSLAVDPYHQGKGVATHLIKRCISEARSKKVFKILSITGAARLFEKQGFHPFNKEKYALFKDLD